MTKYDIKKTISENGIEYGSQLISEQFIEQLNMKIAARVLMCSIAFLAGLIVAYFYA